MAMEFSTRQRNNNVDNDNQVFNDVDDFLWWCLCDDDGDDDDTWLKRHKYQFICFQCGRTKWPHKFCLKRIAADCCTEIELLYYTCMHISIGI